jgi:CheY-like chemotaxis protein
MARVLVIDDDAEIRKLIRAMLAELQAEVIEADNGEAGIAALAAQPADLVITDLLMPTKDGVETIIEIRRRFPDTKVIAMSGGGRVRDMSFLDFAGKVGATATLAKPFRKADLQSLVTKLLG